MSQKKRRKTSAERKIDRAVGIATLYGPIPGERHKLWVIDQMLRALLGDGTPNYERVIANARKFEEGVDWDIGIPP